METMETRKTNKFARNVGGKRRDDLESIFPSPKLNSHEWQNWEVLSVSLTSFVSAPCHAIPGRILKHCKTIGTPRNGWCFTLNTIRNTKHTYTRSALIGTWTICTVFYPSSAPSVRNERCWRQRQMNNRQQQQQKNTQNHSIETETKRKSTKQFLTFCCLCHKLHLTLFAVCKSDVDLDSIHESVENGCYCWLFNESISHSPHAHTFALQTPPPHTRHPISIFSPVFPSVFSEIDTSAVYSA